MQKYNPELQKRSLEMRETRIKESEEFAAQMIRYSKSKMHSIYHSMYLTTDFWLLIRIVVWDIAKIDQARKKAAADAERNQAEEELQKRKEEMRQESLGPVSR